MATAKLVMGLVTTREEAEMAIRRILPCGYARKEVSLLMSEGTRKRCSVIQDGKRSVGGAFGAIVAASVVVPGLGFVVAGPIAAAIASAVVGAPKRGLPSVLISAGIPESEAEFYEMYILDGGILIGIYARNQRDAEVVDTILDDIDSMPVHTASIGRRAFAGVA